MSKRVPTVQVAPAMGAFLSRIQKEKLVNGKHQSDKEIARQTLMSNGTYYVLKKA